MVWKRFGRKTELPDLLCSTCNSVLRGPEILYRVGSARDIYCTTACAFPLDGVQRGGVGTISLKGYHVVLIMCALYLL